jgi:DNA-binding CsgD family transcriptional regulator
MSLTLNSEDVTRLEAAIATALAPLVHDQIGDWRGSVRHALEPLLGAHKSIFVLSAEHEPPFDCEPDILPAMAAYQAHFHTLDPGFPRQARAFAHPVFNWWMLYDAGSLRRSEFYHDYVRRYRLFDPLVAIAGGGTPFPATLIFYHESESSPTFGERELDVLRLVLPALRSGVRILQEIGARHASITTLMETCAWGAALFDQESLPIHENRVLGSFFAQEAEGASLRVALRKAARTALGMGRLPRKSSKRIGMGGGAEDVMTSTGHYCVRGTCLGEEMLGRPAALVFVERVGPPWAPTEELQARYRLTPREVQVARLLARGWSNSRIAAALSISIHTARRHVEHVLLKLDTRSRAAVATKLLEQTPSG